MTRRRWRMTLLAALATAAALYPLTSLFTSSEWLPDATAAIVLVGVVGATARGLLRSRLAVVGVQLALVTYALCVRFAASTFAWGLPTWDTVLRFNDFGLDAEDTIQKYTAPAPLTPGVAVYLTLAVALTALVVDALAATWRSPAAAGLALLTAYLITAANGDAALDARFFLAPAVLWLAMLHTTARSLFAGWSTTSVRSGDGSPDQRGSRRALWSLTAAAVRLGGLGLVLALLVPVVVPHFPTRYLTEGLGRSIGGGGEGTVGFNDTVDLTRSLRDSDATPVLTYTTTGFNRSPLRVLATGHYARGEWRPASQPDAPGQPVPLPPASTRKDYILTVTGNSLRPPRLAAPYPVVAVAMEGTPWSIDPVTRDVLVTRTVSSYRITYADLGPAPPLLRVPSSPRGADVLADDLALPDPARELLRTWSDEVTAGRTNDLDRAIAIQDHLRDTTRYSYTLDLGPPVRDTEGRVVEPIRSFYQSRRGYCVQFATAMIMLARAQGIPARMAIGFLPGTRSGEEYVVRASDAHAWPELYFGPFGWLRFEPTPGTRSGSPPPYAVSGSSAGPTGGGRSVGEEDPASARARSAAAPTTVAPPVEAADTSLPSRVSGLLTTRTLVVAAALLVGVLAAFGMPLTAWVTRLRRRRAAVTQQDLIEVEWEDLTSHLRDLGIVAPEGGTLRQWQEHFIRGGDLDAERAAAMRRVTATLEKARYDRPERTSTEEAEALCRDIRRIRHGVSRTRAWRTRLRSFLWPAAGVSVWRRVPDRLGRWWDRRRAGR
ncbi:MAG TPA: transglutaminaseTgpA domain-containing protein [Intrasporangium sp.]|uniref:transglutaminase family protein n=1 Tax=Intrasporangium sp. TaxID=1925024 RepID=UPI002D77B399|nr:transglutaminaseTgpA domain-containing protein [Intrasporangium sp.]HET7398538.1 transglutaminaseTgpA domain-containing protein [Intrasporangium sp.]